MIFNKYWLKFFKLNIYYLLILGLFCGTALPVRADISLLKTIGEASLFDSMTDMTVNSNGTIYVLDRLKNKIHQVSSNGKYIKSFNAAYYLNVAANSNDELYLRNAKNLRKAKNNEILKGITINTAYTDSNYMQDIAVDKNGLVYVNVGKDIYIYDENLNFLKVLKGYSSTNNGSIVRFGLIKSLKFSGDNLLVEMLGATILLDKNNQLVTKLPLALLKTVATPIKTINNLFEGSYDLAFDSEGFAYVADQLCQCVKKFDSQGNILQTLGGLGNQTGQFYLPTFLTINSANQLLILDTGNFRLQKLATTGKALWSLGDEPNKFKNPQGLAIDSSGHLYVLDQGHARVLKYAADGTWLSTWGVRGYQAGQLGTVAKISINPLNNNIYLQDSYISNNKTLERTQAFTTEGVFLSSEEPALPRFDSKGNSYYLYLKDKYPQIDGSSYYDYTYLLQKTDTNADLVKEWTLKGNYASCDGIACFTRVNPISDSVVVNSKADIYYLSESSHSYYGSRLMLNSTTRSIPVVVDYPLDSSRLLVFDQRDFLYFGMVASNQGDTSGRMMLIYDGNFELLGRIYLNLNKVLPIAAVTDSSSQLYLLTKQGVSQYSAASSLKAPIITSAQVIDAKGTVRIKWKDRTTNETGFKIKLCKQTANLCADKDAVVIKVTKPNVNSTLLAPLATVGSNSLMTFRMTAFKGNEESLVSNEVELRF